MTLTSKGTIEAWAPRGLISSKRDCLKFIANAEGLCPLRIEWEDGLITQLNSMPTEAVLQNQILLPRLIEPHAHLDKAFTWPSAINCVGTYEAALSANLKEHQSRSQEDVLRRGERSMRLALKNGVRAIRSHVDSLGAMAEISWEQMVALQQKWQGVLALQLVALVPIGFWSSSEGEQFARRVANVGGLIGGVLGASSGRLESLHDLRNMLRLADDLGCGIDLHIDESDKDPAVGLRQLINLLDEMPISVPITCSHASSMSLLSAKALLHLAEKSSKHDLRFIALPLTNGWLLAREAGSTPLKRPLAPIEQLQRVGALVAIGGDNVQDPWFPAGNLDPLSLMGFSMPLAQLAPWKRLGLAPFTTAASHLMDLSWDGTIQEGCPADFILVEAGSWAEILSTPPSRQVFVNGICLDDQNFTDSNLNSMLAL